MLFRFFYPVFRRGGFESEDSDSTVQYTAAIRQAPHPLLSFCVLTTQIRRLLACELSLYYVQSHALRPLFI